MSDSLTLLLEGGHRASLAPTARTSLETLPELPHTAWLHLPLAQGGVLHTAIARIVGWSEGAGGTVDTPRASAPVGVPAGKSPPGISPVFAVQLQEVFHVDFVEELLDWVEEHEASFSASRTSTGAINYRESRVCYDFEPFGSKLEARIRELLPTVCKRLQLAVPHGAIESQLTAHNDQNFYKVHNDNSSPDTAHRVLTFVFYFHRQPKGFSNGQLRLYDRKVAGGYRYAADTYKDIDPLHNSIVFFESGDMHEVLPVNCPSREFMDSRFTINGWIAGLPSTP